MLRAKFKMTKRTQYTQIDGEEVTLTPVYSTDPEHPNHRWWKASPSGELRMQITNPEAVGKLELGREYSIDFMPAE